MRFSFFLIAGFCLVTAALSSSQSLKKGQWIKQFHSFSITESLSKNSFRIFSTTLPCPDARGGSHREWAEEPPVFHLLAAGIFALGLQNPALLPLLAYLLFMVAAFLLICSPNEVGLERVGEKQRRIIFLLSATSPVVMRFSIQHLPDLLATALLMLGGYFTVGKRRGWSLIFLGLAVTTKALTIFPAVCFLLYSAYFDSQKKPTKRLVEVACSIGVLASPFLIWIGCLQTLRVSNPFLNEFSAQNRYFGDFSLLLSLGYWLRVMNWAVSKGVGWILFIGFFLSVLEQVQKKQQIQLMPRLELFLYLWAAALIPYWILVRQGNYVHDHYFLPFAFPISVLGSLYWFKKMTSRAGIAVLVSLSITSIIGGALSLTQMKPIGGEKACYEEVTKHF